jgi:hypothetical protein
VDRDEERKQNEKVNRKVLNNERPGSKDSGFFVSCSLFFVLCSLFFVLCSLFLVPCSLFFVPCSLFIIHNSSFRIPHSFSYFLVFILTVLSINDMVFNLWGNNADKPPYFSFKLLGKINLCLG